MGHRLGIHVVVDILLLSEDLHQSWRKLTKAGARYSNCFTLGWSGNSWDRMSQFRHCYKAEWDLVIAGQLAAVLDQVCHQMPAEQEYRLLADIRKTGNKSELNGSSLILKKGYLHKAMLRYTPLVEVNQAVVAWSFRQLTAAQSRELSSPDQALHFTLHTSIWPNHPGLISSFDNLWICSSVSRLSSVLKKHSSERSNTTDYLRNQMELAEIAVLD